MSPGIFLFCHLQGFGWLLHVVDIVEDQVTVGVVLPARFQQGVRLKFCKGLLRLAIAPCQLQGFGQLVQAAGARRRLVALLEQDHGVLITLLRDAKLG